jgi:hypothetical protein
MTGDRILLASRSEGKLRELRPLFAAAGLAVECEQTVRWPPADGQPATTFATWRWRRANASPATGGRSR